MNEYLEKFNKELKEEDKIVSSVSTILLRDKLVAQYSWAIPNDEALLEISKFSPLVEIGAGTGYWIKCLKEIGTKIIGYDKRPYANRYASNRWETVQKGSHRILKTLSEDYNLFLCWPPYKEPMAFKCLKLFKGKFVLYIGEDKDGCTANYQFFDFLEKHFILKIVKNIPHWPCMHDFLSIYERKT